VSDNHQVSKEEENITSGAKVFEGNDIIVKMLQSPGCGVKLEVSVAPQATIAAHRKALKKINREVSVPGFRKGRAPEQLIAKNYKSYVDEQWKEILLSVSFPEAIELVKVYPFSERSVKSSKVESHSYEDGSLIVFDYESEPQIPNIDFEVLSIEGSEQKVIEDKDVAERIEMVIGQYADWEDIEDRSAEEGDFVDIDVEAIDPDPGRKLCSDTRFKVAEGEMGGWMRKAVIGLNAGDSVERVSEFDDSADDDAKENFIPTKCTIFVKKIIKQILPELDDEFSKKVGCENVEDLKNKILEQMKTEAKDDARNVMRRQVDEMLLEKFIFDVPLTVAGVERRVRIRERVQKLKDQKVSDKDIASMEKEIEAEVAVEVDRALRGFFLTRNLAEKNNIEVSEEEITLEAVKYSLYHGKKMSSEDSELRSRIHMGILSDKVKDYLIDNISTTKDLTE